MFCSRFPFLNRTTNFLPSGENWATRPAEEPPIQYSGSPNLVIRMQSATLTACIDCGSAAACPAALAFATIGVSRLHTKLIRQQHASDWLFDLALEIFIIPDSHNLWARSTYKVLESKTTTVN